MSPHLEQTNIDNTMDMQQMMYAPPTFQITAANQCAVVQKVKIFLCRSDRDEAVAGAIAHR